MKKVYPDDRKIVWKNVAELLRRKSDFRPQRVPQHWRNAFLEGAAWRSLQSANVRMLIRTDSSKMVLNWTNTQADWGLCCGEVLCDGKLVAEMQQPPESEMQIDVFEAGSPGKHLWEIHFPWSASPAVESILLDEGAGLYDVGPDSRKVMLAYGSSITQGFCCTRPRYTWPFIAASALGVDFYNLGFGGSAYCEKVVAEYIASRDDWDYLTCEAGTNTGGGFESATAFKKTFKEFMTIIRKSHPQKPILCVTSTIFLDMDNENSAVRNSAGSTFEQYRQVVRDEVAARQKSDKNLFLAEGRDWVNSEELLADRIHPNDKGMKRLGKGIAEAWKKTPFFS